MCGIGLRQVNLLSPSCRNWRGVTLAAFLLVNLGLLLLGRKTWEACSGCFLHGCLVCWCWSSKRCLLGLSELQKRPELRRKKGARCRKSFSSPCRKLLVFVDWVCTWHLIESLEVLVSSSQVAGRQVTSHCQDVGAAAFVGCVHSGHHLPAQVAWLDHVGDFSLSHHVLFPLLTDSE